MRLRPAGARAVGGVCDSTRGGGRAGTRRRRPMQCTTRFCAATECRWDAMRCDVWTDDWGWGARQKREGGREGCTQEARRVAGCLSERTNERTVLYRAAAVFCGLLQVVLMLRVVDVASAGAAIVAAAGCWRAVAVRAMLEVCDMRSICDAMDGRSAMRAGGRAARVLDQAGRQAGK